jgi:hypothetical protein
MPPMCRTYLIASVPQLSRPPTPPSSSPARADTSPCPQQPLAPASPLRAHSHGPVRVLVCMTEASTGSVLLWVLQQLPWR